MTPVDNRPISVWVSKMGHNVGKYIARTAVNIGHFPLSRTLINMLIDDLYRLDGTSRASLVFDTLASHLPPSGHLAACRSLLEGIDALESRVRAYDNEAVLEAAALAVRVQCELTAWQRIIASGDK